MGTKRPENLLGFRLTQVHHDIVVSVWEEEKNFH